MQYSLYLVTASDVAVCLYILRSHYMNLEMQTGNLTCGSSDANYRSWSRFENIWNWKLPINCTAYAWYVRGNTGREYNEYHYENLMQQPCAIDGRIAAYRVEFEVQSCNRSQGSHRWMTYHSCCYSK
jgi:hypothetical protein